MISYHPNKEDINKHYLYSSGFKWSVVDDAEIIAKVITTFVSSPIVWNGGSRKRSNFNSCNWIALDFDNGVSLSSIISMVEKFNHVIGTTKRHQLAKENEPARDRFRVWIQLERKIVDLNEYEDCCRYYANWFRSDIQATDGARKFLPCKKIVSINKNGENISIKRVLSKRKVIDYSKYKDGEIPNWIENILKEGILPGISRNTTCWKIALHMSRIGYTENEIVDRIMNSPLPINQTNKVRNEIVYTVRRAFNYK